MRRRRGLVLRVVFALCLLGATYNHWLAIARHGLLWDHGGAPVASATFWAALAFLDPAAILLLVTRPNVGVAATLAIIVVDVAHNLWFTARCAPPFLQTLAGSPRLIEQIAFMLFVLATVPLAWERNGRQSGGSVAIDT